MASRRAVSTHLKWFFNNKYMKSLFLIILSVCFVCSSAIADEAEIENTIKNTKGFFSSDLNVKDVAKRVAPKAPEPEVAVSKTAASKTKDSFAIKESSSQLKENNNLPLTRAELAKKVYGSTQIDQITETIESVRKTAPKSASGKARSIEEVERVIDQADKLSNDISNKNNKAKIQKEKQEQYTF